MIRVVWNERVNGWLEDKPPEKPSQLEREFMLDGGKIGRIWRYIRGRWVWGRIWWMPKKLHSV